MWAEDLESDENIAWPSYVDVLSTFIFVLILFIGSLLYLLSGDIKQKIIDQKLNPIEAGLKGAGIPYTREGSKVIIPLKGKVEFDTNEHTLLPQHRLFLREVAHLLNSTDIESILVKGTADSQKCKNPEDKFCNWDVSTERASAVLKFFYLCEDCGYDPGRIRRVLKLAGDGDTGSARTGKDESSERRVDVILDVDAKEQ